MIKSASIAPLSKKLVLLVNLGSPAELTLTAIRKFLRQFLSDQRVVGLPRLLWLPILYAIILPLRAKKLLLKYQQIWHESGKSPLVYYSQAQSAQVQALLTDEFIVDYAFCYGERTVGERLKFHQEMSQVSTVTVLPLYPQYSSSTTAAVFDQLTAYYATQYAIPGLKFINSYASHPLYIQAIAGQVRAFWQERGSRGKLIFSFHSLPVKLVENGDSYLAECQATYALVCQELAIQPEVEAKLVFQSKFGKAKWIEPATNASLVALAKAEVARVDVICPGFVSDCLETLEEVVIEYQQLFISHGGKELNYIRCLNDSAELARLIHALVE